MNMRPAPILLTLALAFTSGGVSSRLPAQPPDPGKYSAAEHKLVEFRNQMVPMRDGVKLAIDIFRPEGRKKRKREKGDILLF